MIEKLSIAAIVAICAFLVFIFYANHKDCEESGGFYARGLFSYECIQRK